MGTVDHVLDLGPFGVRIRLLGAEPGVLAFEVTGRPRGLLTQSHVHDAQAERFTVLEGAMRLGVGGRRHILAPGQTMEVAPGTPHTQRGSGRGPGRVRVELRPAGDTEAFLRRLAELSRAGRVNRLGLLGPVAAAELVRDFGATAHASRPSPRVQRALADRVLALAQPPRPYVFVDEWDVAAPPEAVFAALSDARTYPAWWRPVYVEVDADGPATLGHVSHQRFTGRLPYHLRTRSTIVALDPPRTISADVEGDLQGRGTWTLTPSAAGTHVRFDWSVTAERRLLRVLSPALRPLLRWNHAWAIARAMEGLEPYARSLAGAGSTPAAR